MESFGFYISTAFALMLVIEGLLYGLFPDMVRRMMALTLSLPPEKLRLFGLTMAGIGLLLIWAMKNLLQNG
jgi:uncharacterized protein YjeT (DUF2065 family)